MTIMGCKKTRSTPKTPQKQAVKPRTAVKTGRGKAKPKLKPRGWYSKRLDDIAKRFAKERDGYICQKTGEKISGSNAHGSHVIPVSAGINLRWDLNNIKCLSYHYHLNWWHKNPLESSAWFKATFPDRWEYLMQNREVRNKISTPALVEFYEAARLCKTWVEYKDVYERMMRG